MNPSPLPLFENQSQRGSTLFIVLIALVLFSALTYAISRGGEGVKNLSQEKIRLVASEIIDAGNRLSETVARLKLRGVSETEISFEHGADYVNASCATDACKIFAFDGGGLEWELPPADVNNGEDWGYSGDMAITDIGTAAADLVMFLPNLSLDVCHRINVMLSIEAESASPPYWMSAITANQFVGAYDPTPTTISEAPINGKKSGCLQIENFDGTAVDGTPQLDKYTFYQILIAR